MDMNMYQFSKFIKKHFTYFSDYSTARVFKTLRENPGVNKKLHIITGIK